MEEEVIDTVGSVVIKGVEGTTVSVHKETVSISSLPLPLPIDSPTSSTDDVQLLSCAHITCQCITNNIKYTIHCVNVCNFIINNKHIL